MSTTIRLDAGALTKLIEDDPDFKLELQQAVVAEVAKRTFVNYLPDTLQSFFQTLLLGMKAETQDLAKAVTEDESKRRLFTAEIGKVIQSVRANYSSFSVHHKLTEQVQLQVKAEVEDIVKKAVHDATLDIPRRVSMLIDDKVEAYRKKIELKLSGFDHTIAVEMRKQITEAVKEDLRRAAGL